MKKKATSNTKFSIEPTTENSKEVLPDDSEVLHTQGEWYVSKDTDKRRYHIYMNGQHIANCYSSLTLPNEEAKANAEVICKAVNERQKLIDSNRDLAEVLEYVLSKHPYLVNAKMTSIIHNAKNI